MIETEFSKKIDRAIKSIDRSNINDGDTRAKLYHHYKATHTYPCHGYDAAVGDLCLKIEHLSNEMSTAFTSLLHYAIAEPTLNEATSYIYDRVLHISEKYEKSFDEIIAHIESIHNDWYNND